MIALIIPREGKPWVEELPGDIGQLEFNRMKPITIAANALKVGELFTLRSHVTYRWQATYYSKLRDRRVAVYEEVD